jgi:hypothetical protein
MPNYVSGLDVPESFKQSFGRNVTAAAQQRISRILNRYTPQPIGEGDGIFVRVSLPREVTRNSPRNSITPITPQEYLLRYLRSENCDDGDVYDKFDDAFLSGMTSPTSPQVEASVAAVQRWIDRLFIEASLSPAEEREKNSRYVVTKLVPFPASNVIPTDLDSTAAGVASNFNKAKLTSLRKVITESDDDSVVNGEPLNLMIPSSAENFLLRNIKEVSDGRYTDERSWFKGYIDQTYGFRIVRSNLLNNYADGSGNVPVIAWSSRAIFGDIVYNKHEFTIRTDLKNALQSLNRARGGFVRAQDKLISCTYFNPNAAQ